MLEIQRGISLAAQRGDEPQAAILNRWQAEMVLPAFSRPDLAGRPPRGSTRADAGNYRDPLIPATGPVRGAAVETRNINDLEASGVQLVNPWEFLTGE
ncbi:hypothetical protein [Variovorax saccharolyticus]|uniref:hypothetical protein n=1 Tax=Variovorax saccharolyticus TaxID=3053516 RepID=UPI002574E3A8|nr:hypothetical protein [Variovorax sp. J31P216]MDM0029815.1 hypothetical protein [Variovorax sp. J31P216]